MSHIFFIWIWSGLSGMLVGNNLADWQTRKTGFRFAMLIAAVVNMLATWYVAWGGNINGAA
jgi:uncharacterized membrane protein YsdA (DUF1294 family)